MRKKSKLALYTSRRRRLKLRNPVSPYKAYSWHTLSSMQLRAGISRIQIKIHSQTPDRKTIEGLHSARRTFPFTNRRKTPSSKRLQFGTVRKLKTVFSPSKNMSIISQSRQSVKKRPVTPLSKTPKKIRIGDNQWKDVEFTPMDSLDLNETEASEQTDSINSDKLEMINSAFRVLNEAGLGDLFMAFFELVLAKKFPLNNLSFLLFLETIRFYNCESTTEMRYSNETKRFWKSGYRLFHAKFLYFMGGPKHVGEMSQLEESEMGKFKPEEAKINFAVPSVNTLKKFKVTEVDLPGRMPTGVIEAVLDSIAASSSEKA